MTAHTAVRHIRPVALKIDRRYRMGGMYVHADFQRAATLCGQPGTEQDTDRQGVELWRIVAAKHPNGNVAVCLSEVCPACLAVDAEDQRIARIERAEAESIAHAEES